MVSLCRVRAVGVLSLIAATLWGCGGDPADASGSRVSRAYDQFAGAVSDCAEKLLQCSDETTDREQCRDTYRSCQQRASDEADKPLRAAIDACINEDQVCQDAADDAGPFSCSQALRRCIGEPSAPSRRAELPRFDNVDPDAPTYQCFGQLRECVVSERASKGCSERARDCVIVAIGRLDPGLSRTPSARDAGTASASARDAATSETRPGAGRNPPAERDAGAAEPRTRPECQAAHDACIEAGGKPAVCTRARDACEG
jgi:hypothetical protein